MTFRKIYLLAIICLCGLNSCIKVIDLQPPKYEVKNILNCLLNPDSTLTVSLTKSVPINSIVSPPSVTDAKILCYEDGVLLGQLLFQHKGVYTLNYKPQPNHTYRIEAFLPDGSVLSGQDHVPASPTFFATLSGPNIQNVNDNPDITLNVADIDTAKVRLWFSAYLRIFGQGQTVAENQVQAIESISSFLDTFNSSSSGSSIKRSWFFYVRIKPNLIDNKLKIIFNTFNSVNEVDRVGELFFLQFIIGSHSFDKYLKSYITAYNNRLTTNDGGLNNPFAEPSSIYSNVKNGLGIVVGYNPKIIILSEGNK
jgi:hypothetical protein